MSIVANGRPSQLLLSACCLFLLNCEQSIFFVDLKIKHCSVLQSECCFYQDYESSVMSSVKCDAVPAEVDETHSHMQPVVVLETLDLAQ